MIWHENRTPQPLPQKTPRPAGTRPPVKPVISKIGAEMEYAGVEITYQDDNEIPKNTELRTMENGAKLVADTDNVEFVTKETSDRRNFYETIEAGRQALLEFYNYAAAPTTAKHPTTSPADIKIKARDAKLLPWIRPQVTFEIKKDALPRFHEAIQKGSVQYRHAYTYNQTTHEFDKLENKRLATYNKRIQEDMAKAFAGIPTTGEFTENAVAFAKLTVFLLLCLYHNCPANYIKARLPIMPRTSLKSMYQAMPEEEQRQYRTLIFKIKQPFWSLRIPDWEHDNYAIENKENDNPQEYNVLHILNSIWHNLPEFTKDGSSAPTDILSSDVFNSGGDSGASIGALPLPAGAAGVFEIRGMPPVQVTSKDEVHDVYEDVINHYGKSAE